MNLLRTVGVGAALALGAASLSSCLNPPEYPVEPEIDFKEVRKQYYPATGYDTLTFVLDFRDGDGDLGLSNEDILEPPFQPIVNGQRNRNGYNYYIQPFKRVPGTDRFDPYISSPPPPAQGFLGEYDGRFMRLAPVEDKPAPLKGELRYKLALFLNEDVGGLFPGDEFRFEISIKDRALHESNKITTSSVILGP